MVLFAFRSVNKRVIIVRLEFNIVVIDDDLLDDDLKEDVHDLIRSVGDHVKSRGFNPSFHSFSTVEDYKSRMTAETKNRVDLFLSDNNLGVGEPGIEFYIDLTTTGIHDFVLYTRDPHRTIVDALVTRLNESEDPNLFSRFTFVHRETDPSWMEPIEEVIDHILSKREEINNLRGLYAQEMSKVENHLRNQLNARSSDSLETLINNAYPNKIDLELRGKLHKQRHRRNGIIHNDEEFCNDTKRWFVIYGEQKRGRIVDTKAYESDFLRIRTELSKVVDQAMRV